VCVAQVCIPCSCSNRAAFLEHGWDFFEVAKISHLWRIRASWTHFASDVCVRFNLVEVLVLVKASRARIDLAVFTFELSSSLASAWNYFVLLNLPRLQLANAGLSKFEFQCPCSCGTVAKLKIPVLISANRTYLTRFFANWSSRRKEVFSAIFTGICWLIEIFVSSASYTSVAFFIGNSSDAFLTHFVHCLNADNLNVLYFGR